MSIDGNDNCIQIGYWIQRILHGWKTVSRTNTTVRKQKNFMYGLKASNGNLGKRLSDGFFWGTPETTCLQICSLKFPLYDLLSIPTLSLSLHTCCSPFPHELSLIPLIHSRSLHWSGGWVSLPFVPTESIYPHYNFSLTFIQLGRLSPYP